MSINSYQNTDDEVVERFVMYIGSIQGETPLGTVERGQYLEDYLEETNHNSWEGYSDSEIVAIEHFLLDLDRYIFSSTKDPDSPGPVRLRDRI